MNDKLVSYFNHFWVDGEYKGPDMIENHQVMHNANHDAEITQADRDDAMDELLYGDWLADHMPAKLAQHISDIAEAMSVGMDDAHLARQARYLVQLAVDEILEDA